MTTAPVFCDSLGWHVALALVRSRATSVRVLDDIPRTRSGALVRRVLGVFGCAVEETQFFAGTLRGASGEPLYVVAGRRSSEAALQAARAVVRASATLTAINERCGRDRLMLRIARQLWLVLGRQVLQIHVALALSQSRGAVLWLARPTRYDPRVLETIAPAVNVRCYRAVNPLLERARLIAWPAALAAKHVFERVCALFCAPPRSLRDPRGRPGVLLVQEDELSPDHSYRTQPHWLPDRQAEPLPFATYLLAGGPWPSASVETTPSDLIVINPRDLGRIEGAHDVVSPLTRDARQCLAMTFSSKEDWVRTGYAIAARLLLRAAVLSKACRFLDIRVFLSGEPYLFDSDAAHVASHELGIATCTFQYSNLAYQNVILLATSDHMLLFSRRYEELWSHGGVRPREFSAMGYPFDGAFARVRPRAQALRAQLERAGARFVIAYFDENVGPPKYGFIEPAEFDDEIRALAQRVVDDPTLGIIFKSQFRKRSPTIRLAADPVLAAAMATGRVIDLYTGFHRNIVLPAEAALAADLTLSQIIGATAALESALTGTRSVLVNFNGVRTANDELYARGLVVFDSFESALGAVERYRSGDPQYRSLGDWSPFIHELEPFRDGRSSERLRNLLKALVGAPPAAEKRAVLLEAAHA